MSKIINFFLLIMMLILITACENTNKDGKIRDEKIVDSYAESCNRVETIGGIDLAFVIDSSGSMQENDPNNLRLKHAKIVVDQMIEGDRAVVFSFDNKSTKLLDTFSDDKENIKQALDLVGSTEWYTNIGLGLKDAIEMFSNSKNDNKIIITLTDGENSVETEELTVKANKDTVDLSIRAAQEGIVIHAIGLGESVNQEQLKLIAANTGGKYYHAAEDFNLESIYRDVIETVNCEEESKIVNKNIDSAVYFEDEILEKLVKKVLKLSETDILTEKELLNLTFLSSRNIGDNQIKSLVGLEFALNLKELDLTNQTIDNLEPIIGLNHLNTLHINQNELGTVNYLSENQKKLIANHIVSKTNELGNLSEKNVFVTDLDTDGILEVIIIYDENLGILDSRILTFEIINFDSNSIKVIYDSRNLEQRLIKDSLNFLGSLTDLTGEGTRYVPLILGYENSKEYLVMKHESISRQYEGYFYHQFEMIDGEIILTTEVLREHDSCKSFIDGCGGKSDSDLLIDTYYTGKETISNLDRIIENGIKLSNESHNDEFENHILKHILGYATIQTNKIRNEFILHPGLRQYFKDREFMQLDFKKGYTSEELFNKNSNYEWIHGGNDGGGDVYSIAGENFWIGVPFSYDSSQEQEISAVGINNLGIITKEDVEEIMGKEVLFGSEIDERIAIFEYENQIYRFEFDPKLQYIESIFIKYY